MIERVNKVHLEPEIQVEMLRQRTVKKKGNKKENAAVQTLMCFPGIGEKMARVLAKENKTLAESLVFLAGSLPLTGLGPKTRESAREWLGLKTGERIQLK